MAASVIQTLLTMMILITIVGVRILTIRTVHIISTVRSQVLLCALAVVLDARMPARTPGDHQAKGL